VFPKKLQITLINDNYLIFVIFPSIYFNFWIFNIFISSLTLNKNLICVFNMKNINSKVLYKYFPTNWYIYTNNINK
jgi:hypothetical protein